MVRNHCYHIHEKSVAFLLERRGANKLSKVGLEITATTCVKNTSLFNWASGAWKLIFIQVIPIYLTTYLIGYHAVPPAPTAAAPTIRTWTLVCTILVR